MTRFLEKLQGNSIQYQMAKGAAPLAIDIVSLCILLIYTCLMTNKLNFDAKVLSLETIGEYLLQYLPH